MQPTVQGRVEDNTREDLAQVQSGSVDEFPGSISSTLYLNQDIRLKIHNNKKELLKLCLLDHLSTFFVWQKTAMAPEHILVSK